MSRIQSGIGGTATTESIASLRTKDTAIIERRLGEFVTAWNKHDSTQMAAVWHDDGDLINQFGRLAKGRDQVEALFREEHAGPMKSCTHKMTISSNRLLSPEVALVDAECNLTGVRGPDGKELPVMIPHVVLALSKKDGDWKVSSARPYLYAPQPSTKN